MINSPNNPTGVVYSNHCRKYLRSKKNDLWVISDEVYETQIWSNKHISPREIENMSERTLVVGSLSKSHAMTGSRLGWLIGPKEIISKAIDLATNMTYGVPGYIQHAGIFALRKGKNLRKKYPSHLIVDKSLPDILKDFKLGHIPQGAMYIMLDIRSTGMNGISFAHELLDTEKIAVMPGESFGEAASGHVNFTYFG